MKEGTEEICTDLNVESINELNFVREKKKMLKKLF